MNARLAPTLLALLLLSPRHVPADDPPKFTLEGRVLDVHDHGVAGISVRALDERDTTGTVLAQTRSRPDDPATPEDEAGRYRLGDLTAAGVCVVYVDKRSDAVAAGRRYRLLDPDAPTCKVSPNDNVRYDLSTPGDRVVHMIPVPLSAQAVPMDAAQRALAAGEAKALVALAKKRAPEGKAGEVLGGYLRRLEGARAPLLYRHVLGAGLRLADPEAAEAAMARAGTFELLGGLDERVVDAYAKAVYVQFTSADTAWPADLPAVDEKVKARLLQVAVDASPEADVFDATRWRKALEHLEKVTKTSLDRLKR